MARINLLPWRQEERLRKNKEFNAMAGAGAVVAAVAVVLVMGFLGNELSSQQEANAKIENENARLDKVIEEIKDLETKRDEMVSRMKVIQDLQGKRSIPVRVWDDIARAIPSNMYLISIKREKDNLTINGFADNNNVVSQLVRNLDASPWMSGSRIPQIKTKLQAYESALEATKKNTSGKEGERGVLPEDGYVEFTVTTTIKPDEAKSNNKQGQSATPVNVPATTAPAATDAAPANQAPPPATQTPAAVQDMQGKANAAVVATNNSQNANANVGSGDPKPVVTDTAAPANPPPAPPAAQPASQATNSAGGQR